MLSYCLKCKKKKKNTQKKKTESIDPKVSTASNDRTMIIKMCHMWQ